MKAQTHRLTWRGIEIETTYTPLKWGVVDHLEIYSVAPEGAPLPITETGYKSHYHPAGSIAAQGGDVVAVLIAWLDAEAAKAGWKRHEAVACQLSLF